jgi:beta-N-acetylhexosaminidase
VLTLKFRLAELPVPDRSTIGGDAHTRAARDLATAAVTMLRGSCAKAAVTGPVTVTASGGRERTRAALTEALTAAGVRVVPSGGTVVHLVGYGDSAADLNATADVTVAMDTPYLLAKARSPILLATYSSSRASMAGLADVLAGKVRPTGRAPVPVNGLSAGACAR